MRGLSGKATTKAQDERLEARVSRDQKALFQRAAELQGCTLTDFVIASVPAQSGGTAIPEADRGVSACYAIWSSRRR